MKPLPRLLTGIARAESVHRTRPRYRDRVLSILANPNERSIRTLVSKVIERNRGKIATYIHYRDISVSMVGAGYRTL